jgi:DNA-binding CsgD family transcriptional regulator
MEPLEGLGLPEDARRAYLGLIERGGATAGALAEPVLAALREFGLVRGDVPVPPQLAMEELAQRRTREAALARESASLLTQLWSEGAGRTTYLEVLPSPEAARAVLDRVQQDAREHVRAMTVGNLSSEHHTIVDGLFEALGRGVGYQVIYGTRVLRDPAALRMVERCTEAGEQARVVPEVPVNLTIVDDRWALVAARASVAGHNRVAALVVHDSPLLAGLVGGFEVFWRMAVPLTGGSIEGDVPTGDDRRLLSYLSAGLTDESIARELGVSERTVARRISRLQETLGAQTRFQLGVQASRQGWL